MPETSHRMRLARWRATPVVLAVVAATFISPVSAVAVEPTDMVTQWNRHALAAIGNANGGSPPGLNQPPPLAPLHLAMVHTAMYDASNAIDTTHEPYLDGLSVPSENASHAAAVATAAHHVLVGLVPASLPLVKADLDEKYRLSLVAIPGDTQAEADGITIGAEAAADMLELRNGDGRFGALAFEEGTDPGVWRRVAPLSNNVFAWVSEVEPFALLRGNQFRTGGPPDMASEQYAIEFNEVKALGGTNSTRTEDQAKLATFVSTNPIGPISRALEVIATQRGLSTHEQARLYAQTYMSAADAAIGCWTQKVRWNFWRPQTAIQNADLDGNDATEKDASWTSLGITPGYPDMPSGYNCIAASMMHSARLFFGTDRIDFTLNNPASSPPTSRSYSRFTDFIQDAIDGRIFIGFHFRSADVQGAWLGKKVAQWVSHHQFRALD